MSTRNSPGQIRDAIVGVLRTREGDWTVREIRTAVAADLGRVVPPSSVRSYLRLNPDAFQRTAHGRYQLVAEGDSQLDLLTDHSDDVLSYGGGRDGASQQSPAHGQSQREEFQFGRAR